MPKDKIQLRHALVLNRYLLYLFGATDFEAFGQFFNDSRSEGVDENNVSNFYHILIQRLFSNEYLSEAQLLEYDQNIVSHTQHINEDRDDPITWKYFQYLSLMFTEIYMDKFFDNPKRLCDDINNFIDRLNDPFDKEAPSQLETGEFTKFTEKDLNKLAFWNATGSGKTLLMHINILQAWYYQKKYKRNPFENVLLITPNEGLSQQHLKELKISSIPCDIYSKQYGGLYNHQSVNIIEIQKLADETGDKTIAYESFEQNNLILVDEGHRGLGGDQWKNRRDWLSQKGMAIEYSATFGQAVSAVSGKQRNELINEYGKAILFDYSYRYFYKDGYGKDYRILNLPTDDKELILHKYLIGSLLSFYQQKLIWQENGEAKSVYLIDNPLWVFVGSTVTSNLSTKDTSDIVQILRFYKRFIQKDQESKEIIDDILSERDGLTDQSGRSIFHNSFEYINRMNKDSGWIYVDVLKRVFGSSLSGAELYVDDLQGQEGELGIRIGSSPYFGLINVGDSSKLFKILSEDADIKGIKKDFSKSLFQEVNEPTSKINVLIGAKKFTEGWSSWRVSTMGLMNIGRSEGSTVIQLFGRGVRLKGYDYTLKRSTALTPFERPKNGINPLIKPLETLNVFGIRADYMDQFKEILAEEGLPKNEGSFVEIELPTMPVVDLDKNKLKLFRVPDNIDYKKIETLELEAGFFDYTQKIKLDWYPKIQALQSAARSAATLVQTQTGKLTAAHLALFNWFEVYEEIIRFKNERSWYNLSINRETIKRILLTNDWYELYIPEEDLHFNHFENVFRWQEIGIALIKAYIVKFYNSKKQECLQKFIEVVEIDRNDPNFFEQYKFEIEQSEDGIIRQILAVKQMIEERRLPEEVNKLPLGLSIFQFANHLYAPLVAIDNSRLQDIIRISPVALNKGEERFVKDLKHFYELCPDYFKDKNLFLLRNASRKGIGFFEANNFYPDFILWLIQEEKQFIGFVDPKGLRQINGFDNPKIKFGSIIKNTIQPRVQKEDPNMFLSSFILSTTPHEQIKHWRDQNGITDFNKHNVYFLGDQEGTYISSILHKIIAQE